MLLENRLKPAKPYLYRLYVELRKDNPNHHRKRLICNVYSIYSMTSGMWFVVVIPAVLSFVFSVWVTINIMMDVAKRGTPHLAVREQLGQGVVKFKEGQGVVKLKVPSLSNESNNP